MTRAGGFILERGRSRLFVCADRLAPPFHRGEVRATKHGGDHAQTARAAKKKAMSEIIVTHEGQEIRVPIDNLNLPEGFQLLKAGETPEGFMPVDRFQSEVKRSAERMNKGLVRRDDLLSDDDFFKSLAQKRGIELSDDLKPVAKLDPEVLKRYQSDWAANQLEPVSKENAELKAQNEALRRENQSARSQQALLQELKPAAFKPIGPGLPSPFDTMMGHFVKFDEDGKPFFQAEAAGMPEYDVPKAVLAYVKKNAADLVADRRAGSTGLGSTDGTGGGKTIRRSDFDALGLVEQGAFVRGGGKVVD